MLFNSYIFILCFLPISVLGYYLINRPSGKKRESLRLLWLSLVSLCFFVYAGIQFFPVLMGSIIVNFLFGYLLKNKKWEKKKKYLLGLGVAFQLLLLFYYKYSGFFLEIVKIKYDFHIMAPLGISFFTFSQISWLVDSYREAEDEKCTFLEYCTYITFFPKLTMGPIALQKDFIPQLRMEERRKINYENFAKGIYLFSLGLAKKVLVADTLAKIVSIGYADVISLNSITAFVVMVSYTLQLYFDFSGYCDMARGVGLFFNIHLPVNFNSPYKAKSISEFWQRWHMTLTKFFTAYLYIPLGGSRRGKIRTYCNTFLVFLISGLWHGANWTFLFWGALHGGFMVVEKIVKDMLIEVKKLPFILEKIKDFIQWGITFTFVNIAWIFFRSENMEQGKLFLSRLFSGGWKLSNEIKVYVLDIIEIRVLKRIGMEGILESYVGAFIIFILISLIGSCFFTKNTNEKEKNFNYSMGKGVITVVLLVWCIISLSSISEFLYFEF